MEVVMNIQELKQQKAEAIAKLREEYDTQIKKVAEDLKVETIHFSQELASLVITTGRFTDFRFSGSYSTKDNKVLCKAVKVGDSKQWITIDRTTFSGSLAKIGENGKRQYFKSYLKGEAVSADVYLKAVNAPSPF
jgi:hypothetical protein